MRHKTVAVTTLAVDIATLTGLNAGPARTVTIQPALDSAVIIYGGGKDSTLTTADYGWTLPVPDSGVPVGPFMYEGINISLADILVRCTTTTGKIAVSVVYGG